MLELKEIEEFPGYKAGSDGHIYSYLNTRIGGYNYDKEPKKLKGHPSGTTGRYLFLVLRKDGKNHYKSTHRLICEAFNGKPNENQDASHLDGNDKNNAPGNLVWENRSVNCHRKKSHGTDDIGIKNKRALFNIDQLIQIRKWLAEGITSREIGKRMRCNERQIGKIKRGEHYFGQGEIL
jgi:hypothetical protein